MCLKVENVFECVTIEMCIKNHKNIVVNCLYRTPGSSIDHFNEHFFLALLKTERICTFVVT